MSIQRSFAERKNNVVNVVPELATSGYWGDTYLLKIDPTTCSTFNVDITNLETDGTYTMDPTVDPYGYTGVYIEVPQIFSAIILDPKIAKTYPGLEFTVNFINMNTDEGIFNSIRVYPTATLDDNGDIDEMISPLQGFLNSNIQSLTLKSNGTMFAIVSSGVTPWYYVD